MDCAEEVAVLKREVGPAVGGAERLSFDILNGKMTVAPGPGEVSPEVVLRAVERTGMRAEVWREDDRRREARERAWQRRGRAVLTAASGLSALAGFLTHTALAGGLGEALGSEGLGLAHQVPLPARGLYALAVLAGLWMVLPKAWYAARRLRPDMNLLMVIAVAGAVGIGEWFEAATVA